VDLHKKAGKIKLPGDLSIRHFLTPDQGVANHKLALDAVHDDNEMPDAANPNAGNRRQPQTRWQPRREPVRHDTSAPPESAGEIPVFRAAETGVAFLGNLAFGQVDAAHSEDGGGTGGAARCLGALQADIILPVIQEAMAGQRRNHRLEIRGNYAETEEDRPERPGEPPVPMHEFGQRAGKQAAARRRKFHARE